MIQSLHARILRRWNTVRGGIVRPETVVRYLTRVGSLDDYRVHYYSWLDNQGHKVTGEEFLALYAAGAIPVPRSMRERERSGV